MEYRDRDQGAAFLYNRLGWEVRDRGAEPEGKLTALPELKAPPLDDTESVGPDVRMPKLGDV
jgi:hypothetical protein